MLGLRALSQLFLNIPLLTLGFIFSIIAGLYLVIIHTTIMYILGKLVKWVPKPFMLELSSIIGTFSRCILDLCYWISNNAYAHIRMLRIKKSK